MARYPLKPEKLLDTAERLVPRQAKRGKPAHADHRRAISTTYYAVFHALGDRVAKAVFTEADDAFLHRVERWIGHNDMAEVSKWICQLEGRQRDNPPAHIVALLEPPGTKKQIDAETVRIAEGFLELNDKREQADYDHDAVFTRADTLAQIDLAKATVALIEGAQSEEAKIYFGLIAMRAKIQSR